MSKRCKSCMEAQADRDFTCRIQTMSLDPSPLSPPRWLTAVDLTYSTTSELAIVNGRIIFMTQSQFTNSLTHRNLMKVLYPNTQILNLVNLKAYNT